MVRLAGESLLLPVVSNQEAEEFKESWENGPPHCCTAESFRIDIRGAPKSAWNRSAAQVFARSYVGHYRIQADAETLNDIANRAMTRIKSLRFMFQKKNISQQRRTELERAGRRYGRKFTVSGDLSATKQNRIDNNPILDLSTALRSVLTASPTFPTYGNDSAAWGQWNVFR